MGLRDAFLSRLVALLFQRALIMDDPTNPEDVEDMLVWKRVQVLIIDGSLFYRKWQWAALGATWQSYLSVVSQALLALMDRCPVLQSVVFIIDKYGPGTLEPLPKRVIQASRYEGANPIADVANKFAPDKPVAGLDSTDVFGNLDARMAFNEMMTEHLRTELLAYSAQHPLLDHIIIDGAVRGGIARTMLVPPAKGTPSEPPPSNSWCPHSEGDIAIAHWMAEYGHRTTLIRSADIDIQQVGLRVVQRWADSGLQAAEFSDCYLHKVAHPVEQIFDLKLYYQMVCTIFGAKNAAPDHVHPLDIWTMLTACSGNDFCAPWLCSPECARGENDKKNDGIRLEHIWYAYVKDFRSFGPLFEPTTEADRWTGGPWSVLQCDTYVYPIRPVVEGWRRLMVTAMNYQKNRTPQTRVAASELLLDDRTYVAAQLQRMTWSIFYYANAALVGDKMPRGVETDKQGRSLHGWMSVPGAKPPHDVVTTNNVASRNRAVLHALWNEDAPTQPPSPDQDPLAEFARLENELI